MRLFSILFSALSASLRGTPKQPHHKFASKTETSFLLLTSNLAMALALVFFSCNQKQEEQKASLLSDFWKKEIARLNKEKPMITKISTVNGKTDTIVTDSIDWEKELQIFVKNDLRESDLAMYTADTVSINDLKLKPIKGIVYTARNDIQELRNMSLCYDESQKIDWVEIVIKNNQDLYASYKRLIYVRQNSFQLEGSQDVKFLHGINYKVQVKFKE
jgi:hypothetical protein